MPYFLGHFGVPSGEGGPPFDNFGGTGAGFDASGGGYYPSNSVLDIRLPVTNRPGGSLGDTRYGH